MRVCNYYFFFSRKKIVFVTIWFCTCFFQQQKKPKRKSPKKQKRIQRPIFDDVYFWQAFNPFDNINAAKFVHYTADFSEKVDKMQMLIKTGVMDANPIKYLPNILELAFKGLVYGLKQKSTCRFNL